MKRFWMVYVEGKDAPTKKHDSFESATIEADRLARVNRGTAYVLRATVQHKAIETLTVKETRLR